MDLQDINNIITQFSTCFILFKYAHLTDTLSAECLLLCTCKKDMKMNIQYSALEQKVTVI